MRPESKPWGMELMWELSGRMAQGKTVAEISAAMHRPMSTVRRQIGFMEIAVFGDRAELSATTKGE